MPQKIRTLLPAVAAIFVVAILAFVILSRGRTPAQPPLPNPNGYDDFLRAAALLAGDVGNAPSLDLNGLRALVSSNGEPLRLVRLGLSRQCALPMNLALTNLSVMLGDLANFKSLARILVEEGRLAELEARPGDAARSYVDVIRFGNEMSRGGFIINRLVGIACEGMGNTALGKLVPKLNREASRAVLAELEKIDRAEVTWDEVARSENVYAQHELGKILNLINWVIARWQARVPRQRAEMKDKKQAAHARLLIAELALRCYQSDQGSVPDHLEQLVPKYLQRLPSDPFSGHPLIYRSQGTNWLVYSVGEDGLDDGGSPVGRSVPGAATKGDLFYDSPY